MTLYTPKTNKLYKLFLDTKQSDKIPLKWIHQNKFLIMNDYPDVFAEHWPDEDDEMENEAADNMRYLNSTCGRGVI